LAWEGSFIKGFAGRKAEFTLISELYTPVICGKNRITDMNSVRWEFASCQGAFYIPENLKKFSPHPNISLPLFGRYNGKGKGVCLCHVTTGEEVNLYEETFLP